MNNLLRILFSCLICIFVASCSEDESVSHESYLKGVYSNYSEDETPNLDITYNGVGVKDKEVSVNTIDDLAFDVLLKNILTTPDVLFSDVVLQKSGDDYVCEMDSVINNKEVHVEMRIKPEYNQEQSDKANANMVLDVAESEVV